MNVLPLIAVLLAVPVLAAEPNSSVPPANNMKAVEEGRMALPDAERRAIQRGEANQLFCDKVTDNGTKPIPVGVACSGKNSTNE